MVARTAQRSFSQRNGAVLVYQACLDCAMPIYGSDQVLVCGTVGALKEGAKTPRKRSPDDRVWTMGCPGCDPAVTGHAQPRAFQPRPSAIPSPKWEAADWAACFPDPAGRARAQAFCRLQWGLDAIKDTMPALGAEPDQMAWAPVHVPRRAALLPVLGA